MERTEYGTSAATEGWFAVNLHDAAWVTNDDFGAACIFEGEAAPFAQVGYTVAVLAPGQPNGLYHHESVQEGFLVLSGECLVVVDSEEHRLRQWDYFHCPPDVDHILIGAGDGLASAIESDTGLAIQVMRAANNGGGARGGTGSIREAVDVLTVSANLVRYGMRDHRLGAVFLSVLGLLVAGFMVLLSAQRAELLKRYERVRQILGGWE